MYENFGARAEANNDSNSSASFSIADMQEFRPPTIKADTQLAQMMSPADLWAGYDKQTYAGISALERGNVLSFGGTFLNGNEKVKSELKTALDSAGIKLESDGQNVKLSLKENLDKSLTIGPSGVTPPDRNLINQIQERILNRPEVRRA